MRFSVKVGCMSANFLPRCAASLAIAGLVGFGSGLLPAAVSPTSFVADAATPVMLNSQLVDDAGVIKGSQKGEIESALKEGISKSNIKLYEVFVTDAPGGVKAYAEQLRQQNNTSNVMIMVVDTKNSRAGWAVGSDVRDSEAKDILNAAQKSFTNGDFTQGAQDAADAVAKKTSTSSKVWMGAGAVVLLGGGAGAVIWSKKRRRQQDKEQLEAARTIEPDATTDLAQQPTPVLRTLAQEELGSTDESIRKGEEELGVAVGEFGETRTADLAKALAHSRTTLNKAYGKHQRIRSGLVSTEDEERALLIDIISSCGSADKNLDEQADRFEQLRQKLIHAPEDADKLVQMTVSLRSRIPGAEAILEDLKTRVDPELLTSIEHNPQIAEEEIKQAEAAIDKARQLLSRPAGQQGGLVDALGAARMAIQQADSQLVAVEEAEDHLTAARTNLGALITEVEEEIGEAGQLRNSGASVNQQALDGAVAQAQQALQQARERGDKDPLGCYSALLEADGALDIQLDEARGAANDFRRTVEMVDRTITDVEQRLKGVEDTIRNRRSIIGVDTRTAAQAARDALNAAYDLRTKDPKQAFLAAQQASQLANQALMSARDDIDRFNRHNSGGYGGGGSGMLTGMVLGSLLSGHGGFGGFGGYGGGFGGGFGGGGGGFDGGGFGGSGDMSF